MVNNQDAKSKIMNYCKFYVVLKSPKPITVSELYSVISDKRLGVSNTLSSKRQLGNLLNKRWEGNRNFKKSYTKRNEVMWRCE